MIQNSGERTMPREYADIGESLKQYSAAVAVKNMRFDQSVKVDEGRVLIAEENLRDNPSIYNVIQQIIAHKSELKMIQKEGDKYPSTEVFTHSGGQLYSIKLEEMDDGKRYKVTLNSKVEKNDDGKLEERAINYEIETDLDNDKLSIILGKTKIFQTMVSPRAIQNQVLSLFSEQILKGQPRQLVVMGTGSGKSFVIAGAAHAASDKRNVVMIVPTLGDGKQLQGDIAKVQGGMDIPVVDGSADEMTIEKFNALLIEEPKGKQIILRADDKYFKQKSALVSDCMVLIDESHTHTFNEYALAYLEHLKKFNCTLAVTGTPTGKLQQLFGIPFLDVNLRTMQNAGLQRYIYPQVDKHLPDNEESLIHHLIQGYFGRVSYLRPHETQKSEPNREPIGYKSPQYFIDQLRQSPEEAINSALENNKVVCLNQKNFIFSGDAGFRKKMLDVYCNIAKGKYEGPQGNFKALESEIEQMRRDSEILERISLMETLPQYRYMSHSERHDIAIQQVNQNIKKVNLLEEIQFGQKLQVAQSINAIASESFLKFLGITTNEDFGALVRQKKLQEYILKKIEGKKTTITDNDIDVNYQKAKKVAQELAEGKIKSNDRTIDELKPFLTLVNVVKDLPEPHKKKYEEKALLVFHKILLAVKDPKQQSCLLNENDIDWPLDYATSIVPGDDKNHQWTEDEIKAASRAGCVMHLASDTKISAGYSDPFACSVQQALLSNQDPLRSSENTAQLFGRVVRGSDGIAFAQQVVVADVSHYDLESVVSNESNADVAKFRDQEFYREGKEAVEKVEGSLRRKEVDEMGEKSQGGLFHLGNIRIPEGAKIEHVIGFCMLSTNTLLSEIEVRENLIRVLENKSSNFSDNDNEILKEAKEQLHILSKERVRINHFFIQEIDKSILKAGQNKAEEIRELKFYRNLLLSRAFDDALGRFRIKLETLKKKATDKFGRTKNNNYAYAYNEAADLYGNLESLSFDYFNKHATKESTAEEWDKFRKDCITKINKAKPVLEKHRGFSEILHNLLFYVVSTITFGVAPGLHKYLSGEARFFKPPKTDSAQELEILEKSIGLKKD